MAEVTTLLDTPKKQNLKLQSTTLRATLKDFERTFTETHGHKPSQTDVKKDATITAKYKEYQRIQDVLKGKLAYEKLNDTKPTRHASFKSKISRTDSGIGSSPKKESREVLLTPKKSRKLGQRHAEAEHEHEGGDEDEAEVLQSVMLTAIGPTPHRDGKVLGLFDLLSRSGSSNTPSTARKRKVDELFEDTPISRRAPLCVIQTPSGRTHTGKRTSSGDLLEFLSGTPVKQYSHESTRKFSRTPQSEGKKFHLSQFFATPETARVLFRVPEETAAILEAENTDDAGENNEKQQVMRDSNDTPRKGLDTSGLDATPTYLKRSTSFKDRLLSASMAPGASLSMETRRTPATGGPPILRSFRSSTSNVLKDIDIEAVKKSVKAQSQPLSLPQRDSTCHQQIEDDYDDEMDVLRELETEQQYHHNGSPEVLVEDSQLPLDFDDNEYSDIENVPVSNEDQTVKPYKKKGQKRTTKRSNIRPAVSSKQVKENHFVAADGVLSEDEDEDFIKEAENLSEDEFNDEQTKKRQMASSEKQKRGKGKQAGMINPNAQSHTNYQRLKIRGKNSRATGASKGKFGRRR